MTPLPAFRSTCPTLEAADQALEERAKQEPKRDYLGMSAIGHPCERKLWYDVNDPLHEQFDAATLKRFEDGHRSEALMASRLRMVPGIQLWTVDPDTGEQFECTDFKHRFRGHMDGVILGLIQAPKTPHVWEAKAVKVEKFREFQKLKERFGEKDTLEKWDYAYWCQAQTYMGYFDLTRHYITVSTPGVRDWDSARTEFNPEAFANIRNRAQRVLESSIPLARMSQDPSWYLCKWCVYRERCHGVVSN